MSKRYPGNFITGNPVALSQTSNNGIWDVKDVSTAVSAGVWQEPDGNYEIAKSLRFKVAANGSSGSYLSRTPTSAGNRRTWTWSGWVKRTRLDTGYINGLFEANDPSNTQIVAGIRLETDGTLKILDYNSGYTTHVITTQVFRDVSAWYHIMVAYDTTQANSSNRVKLYVNGQQVTSFSTATYPSLNSQGYINTAGGHYVGACIFGSVIEFLDGYMAEVNFIDGQALDASYFGYTDGVTGNWHPKKYTGSYGQNGFYLPFKSDALTYQVGPFNGSTQTLTAAGNTAFDLTGDFCIETWMYPTSVPDPTGIWSLQPSSGGSGIRLTYEASQIRCALISGVGTLYTELNGPSLPLNMWHHVAVTRSGSAFKMFINGVVVASATNTGWAGTSSPLIIGGARNYGSGSPFYFTGVLSNFRIVKGYPVYTSNFIPPTSPLAAIPGTSILTCQSATIVDNGPNAITISNNNTVSTAQTIPWLALDNSGNGNNYAPQGPISVTPGVNFDLMVDSPTNVFTSATDVGGVVSGNYCTWNANHKSQYMSILDSALKTIGNGGANDWIAQYATMSAQAGGKWYWEYVCFPNSNSSQGFCKMIGMVPPTAVPTNTYIGNASYGYALWVPDGSGGTAFNKRYNGTNTTLGSNYALVNGDVIQVAYDALNGQIWFGKNNTWFEGNPSAGTGASYTGIDTSVQWLPAINEWYAAAMANNFTQTNFGQRPFAYTPPTGFKSLNTTNMQALGTSSVGKAAIQANKWMDVSLYGGTSSTLTVTNSGFQPDLIWIKRRTAAGDHALLDVARGPSATLASNSTDVEANQVFTVVPNSTGFTINSSDNLVNGSTLGYVAWQWKQSPSSGLNIIPYTGTGVARSISHNLGVAPRMMMIKRRDTAANWIVYHSSISTPQDNFLYLNSTSTAINAGVVFNSSNPSSSVFTVGTDATTNANGGTYIAYLFAEVPGFSKIGSYTGNGNVDGTFVYTGFKPRFILIRSTTDIESWVLLDSERGKINTVSDNLLANVSNAANDVTAARINTDFLSNGFKLRNAGDGNQSITNKSSSTYIYAAFAESPFALNNRAR
jgi:hypothetical protein